MMNFCTLFDSYYIHKGIALYLSLEKVTNDFHLYVMAFDLASYSKLRECNFDKMTIELLDDFETPELLAVKHTRTKAEYCWTAGPSVIWHFMNKYNLPDITYLDSDLYFVSDPVIAFKELGDASVGITEQGISEKKAKLYGRYCVQYMFFRNDENGRAALSWWRDSCIEWCFQRFEGDKYGDQKYLDKFPVLFKNVHVFANLGLGIATWNKDKYVLGQKTIQYQDKVFQIVFFHMHAIKAYVEQQTLVLDAYISRLRQEDIEYMFKPYAEYLRVGFEKYLGKTISGFEYRQMSKTKEFEYKIRGLVRNNPFVQWLYFKLLKKTYKGHGNSSIS